MQAKAEQLQQIEVQRNQLEEQRRGLVERQQAAMAEVQPSLEEIDAQIKELNDQQSALTGVEVDHEAAIEAARQADVEARAAVQNVYEQVLPMMLQGQRINQIAEARLQAIQERVPKIITDELNAGFGEITENLQSLPGLGGQTSLEDLPPISLMVAGFAAPAQLKMAFSENISRLGLSAALLAIDLLALILGYGKECISFFMGYKGNYLKPWMYVDLASLLFTVIVRSVAHGECSATLKEVDKMQNEIPDLPADPGQAFRITLERNLLGGARAMLQYDRLANSTSFKLLDILPIFDLIWQFGGIALLFDTPDSYCQARFLMYWARLRGVVFLIGLLPTLITLGLVIVKAAVASQGFCMAVLKAAAAADKSFFPSGPPVITVLVRAFLVRDTTDMQRMELQVYTYETKIAQAERDGFKSQFEAAESKAAKMEEHMAALQEKVERDSREQEFMRTYKEAMQPVLQAAEIAMSADPATAGLQAASAAAQSQLQAAMASVTPPGHPPTPVQTTPRGTSGETEETGGTGSAMFHPFGMPPAPGIAQGAGTAAPAGTAAAPSATPSTADGGASTSAAPGAGSPGDGGGS